MEKSDLLMILFLSFFSYIEAQVATACQRKVCPAGFTRYEPSNKCYALTNVRMKKDDHIAQCTRLAQGAFVVAPLDAGENKFISKLILASPGKSNCLVTRSPPASNFYSYFSGGESCERKACKAFQWRLAGDMFQKMSFTSFVPQEPNCSLNSEFCLLFNVLSTTPTQIEWNDISCDTMQCGICEFRL